MKKLLKKTKHLQALLLVCIGVFSLAMLGAPAMLCFTLLALWQLSQFAMSRKSFALYTSLMTPDQVKEFSDVLGELFTGEKSGGLDRFKKQFEALAKMPDQVKLMQDDAEKLKGQLTEARRMLANQKLAAARPRGRLSDMAAAQLGAHFTLHLARQNKLEACVPDASLRTALISETRGLLGMPVEKALSASDIPLPVQYFAEIRDLIAEYGVLRNAMTPWPLSGGTDKPPRGKTRFALTSIAMSAQFGEKTPQIEFASLESHKVGGIIYTPRELREQSIVALGQYIARLAGVAAAQVEDEWGFLADGTATYESVSGVFKVANTNSKIRQLASGKTKPSDVTAADFRALFALVNSRVRATGVWYLNNTWEAYLPELNTTANQYIFRYNNAGQALLFGRPIVFTEVITAFGDTASPSSYIAAFGDLSYWWFGQRGNGLRIDESSDFKFDYDLISTRMIEEIDFDYMATDAVAGIQTAAS